jgi:hypothetical protein
MTEKEVRDLIRFLKTHELRFIDKESKFYVEGEGKQFSFSKDYYVSLYEKEPKWVYEDGITMWSELVIDYLKDKGILK